MPKNDFIDFRAIKANLPIEWVLEHYSLLDTLKRSGDSLSGPCPIHKGNNPTQFRVSISKNIWNCFSECKHGGNVLDFIARIENISIYAAAMKAVAWFKLSINESSTRDEPDSEDQSPAPKRNSRISAQPTEGSTSNLPLKFRLEKLDGNHVYLTDRGLTQETIAQFGIGFCKKGMMKDYIAIPIHNLEARAVGYAGRWPGNPPEGTPKYKLPPGFRKSLELFNIDRAIREPVEKPLIIVEGFFDCMKLWQLGIKRVVALMGSTLSPAQEELIRKHVTPGSQIVIILDEDDAGRAGRDEIAVRLAKFAFVKIHTFKQEGGQPEHLTAEELSEICGGDL